MTILASVLGKKNAVTVKTIEKQGKITREHTYLNYLRHVFSLSKHGLMIAESRLDESFEYPEITKEKVVTSHFFHDLYVQALTSVAIKNNVSIDFATPRMSGLAGKEDKKIPDVIWRTKEDLLLSVEVEINQKWEKHLDNFLAKTIENIESGEMAECLVITPSRATLRNYTKSLERSKIPVWVRKSGGIWRQDREVLVRQAVKNRISIVYVSEMDMHRTISKLSVSNELEVWMAEHSMENTASALD